MFVRPCSLRAALFLFAFVASGLLLPELHRYEHVRYAEDYPVTDGIAFLDGDREDFHECILCEVRLIGITPPATDVCLSVISIRETPIIAESAETVAIRPFNGRAPPALG